LKKNGKIILGVCGSIAAYKTIELNRRLIDAGFDVTVVLTQSALNFTAKLPYQIFNGKEPLLDMFSNDETCVKHVELANEADLLIVCAATANTIAKFHHGVADNFLSTIYLARKQNLKTIIVPAMNTNMWNHPATVRNVQELQKRGVDFWGPGTGKLACGEGEGRMIDVEQILENTLQTFHSATKKKKKMVITAGATREYIDPIRYITNGSSGKTGIAIANEAFQNGYDVTLIGGNIAGHIPSYINSVPVTTCNEMEEAMNRAMSDTDVLVMTAAIGDYTPVSPSNKKIKKTEENLKLEFSRNKDLVSEARKSFPSVYIVGFSAETNNLVENATDKMKRKGFDMVCANMVTSEENPFGSEKNQLLLIKKNGEQFDTGQLSKSELARIIVNKISEDLA